MSSSLVTCLSQTGGSGEWGGQGSKWVKALAAKPGDQRLILGTHMGEGES